MDNCILEKCFENKAYKISNSYYSEFEGKVILVLKFSEHNDFVVCFEKITKSRKNLI